MPLWINQALSEIGYFFNSIIKNIDDKKNFN